MSLIKSNKLERGDNILLGLSLKAGVFARNGIIEIFIGVKYIYRARRKLEVGTP